MFCKDTVCKWMHELEHYGFIVEVRGAHLGVTGTGKAARYRLTDCPHRAAIRPPTISRIGMASCTTLKNKTLSEKFGHPVLRKPDTQSRHRELPRNGNKRPIELGHKERSTSVRTDRP